MNNQASESTKVEQARAAAEVAAAVQVAQNNPRDIDQAIAEMQAACSRESLAKRAFYSLPRAGGKVEGSTVHFARELARCYGNVEYGIRELARDDIAGQSELQAWAWDQERNVRQTRAVIVPHARMARGSRQQITDLTDIINNNNSFAARALRECILTLLPVWFRDEAEELAAKTLQGDPAVPLENRISAAIEAYANSHRVTLSQLEARLGSKRAKWTATDVAVLNVLFHEMSRGEKHASDEFPTAPLEIEPKGEDA